jgi:hypothetical protein
MKDYSGSAKFDLYFDGAAEKPLIINSVRQYFDIAIPN